MSTAFMDKSQELADLIEPDEGELVSKLKDIRDTRDALAKTSAFLKGLEAPLRAFFEKHPDARLTDGEHGLEAFSQFGGTETIYDSPAAIKKRDKVLYRRLVELGAIVEILDKEKVSDAIKAGWLVSADLNPFRKEKERSRSLQVKLLPER